jgi:hypothetical protein
MVICNLELLITRLFDNYVSEPFMRVFYDLNIASNHIIVYIYMS